MVSEGLEMLLVEVEVLESSAGVLGVTEWGLLGGLEVQGPEVKGLLEALGGGQVLGIPGVEGVVPGLEEELEEP